MLLTVTSILILVPLLWVQRYIWQDNLELLHSYQENMLRMREVRDQLSIKLNQQTEKLFQLQCQMGNDVSCTVILGCKTIRNPLRDRNK